MEKVLPETKDPFLIYSKWYQYLADFLFDPDKYFVFSPWCQRIGHISFEIMLAVSVAKRDNKQLVLIPQFKSVNKEVFKCQFNCPTYNKEDWRYWILKIALNLSGLFHYGYNGIRCKIIKIIPFLSEIMPAIFFYPCYGIEKGPYGVRKLRGTKVYVDYGLMLSQKGQSFINSKQLNRGDKIREKMGIPKTAWFVCLHVREQGYLGAVQGHVNDIRNCAISNYLPAIRYITNKGGFVVRMGDPTMTLLPSLEKVIDYAHSNFRSELMDIYLSSQCRFLLGSSSGMVNLGGLFHNPICWTNMIYPAANTCSTPQTYIQKHFYSIKEHRFLSFKEAIALEGEFHSSEYFVVENTPEEILETVKEFIQLLKNENTNHINKLQDEIREMRHQHLENLLKKNDTDDNWKDVICGRLLNRENVGRYYLERCWEDTPYLKKLTQLYNTQE